MLCYVCVHVINRALRPARAGLDLEPLAAEMKDGAQMYAKLHAPSEISLGTQR